MYACHVLTMHMYCQVRGGAGGRGVRGAAPAVGRDAAAAARVGGADTCAMAARCIGPTRVGLRGGGVRGGGGMVAHSHGVAYFGWSAEGLGRGACEV